MTEADKEAALGSIRGTTALEEVAPADVVIEAVTENYEVKLDLLQLVDALVRAETIIASNTSSISITKLAAAISHPERFIGMHFFNPVPVMALVEIVRGLQTSDATHDAIEALALQLGKSPNTVKSGPGFPVNRILLPMINEAFFVFAGRCQRDGNRRGHDARLQPPDGPVGAGRFNRPRCAAGGHAVHSRRVRRSEIPGLSAAQGDGRCGLPRP